jgi:hypothetical protein
VSEFRLEAIESDMIPTTCSLFVDSLLCAS